MAAILETAENFSGHIGRRQCFEYLMRSFRVIPFNRDQLKEVQSGELIKILEIENPSVSLAEIISCLEEMDGVEVSMATVFRALQLIILH